MARQSARTKFLRAAYAGSLVAIALDVLMLSAGHFNLWQRIGLLGSFYDIQGRALLHGQLAVPVGSASFEGFVIGGHTYLYFGLVPALFRLPILLITHRLDGRMTQLSMLAGFVTLLVAGARLHWRVRDLLRPGAPVTRIERAAVFLLALALGAGAVPLFLASWAVVYHEAELWGAALSLAAIATVLAIIEQPTGQRIVGAGVLATLAVNTRVSVGLGPIIALAIVALAVGATGLEAAGAGGNRAAPLLRLASRFGPREVSHPLRTLALLGAGCAIALGSAVAVNEARFHSAFSIPLAQQIDTQIDPNQRAFVAAYHGAATGLRFVPTTLLAAVRPDAIGTVRAFPFVGLPQSPPTVIGSVRFNALLPSLSAFTSMPLFCVLLLVALPGLIRQSRAAPLLGMLAATGLAFVPVLVFGSTATRYLADVLPFLFLGACCGLHTRSALRTWALRSQAGRRLSIAAVASAAVVGIAVNGSVGLVEQRLIAPSTTAATRASFIARQDEIDRFLGRSPHGIHSGAAFPTRSLGPVGDLFVLGRCDGLYVESFGGTWLPVERTPRAGLYALAVAFRGADRWTRRAPLLTLGTGPERTILGLAPATGGRAVFSVRVGGRAVRASGLATVRLPRRTLVTVSIDRLGEGWFLSVSIPGHGIVLSAKVPFDQLARAALGVDPSDPQLGSFPGTVAELPERTPVCDRVARRAGLLSGA